MRQSGRRPKADLIAGGFILLGAVIAGFFQLATYNKLPWPWPWSRESTLSSSSPGASSATATQRPRETPFENPRTPDTPANRRVVGIGPNLTATFDSVKVDTNKFLNIWVRFSNTSAHEMAIYIGNPTGQWVTATHQRLALSAIDNNGVNYYFAVLPIDGVTIKSEAEAGLYRVYAGPNQYVSVPQSSDATLGFHLVPRPYPTLDAHEINFNADLRVLDDVANKRTYDKSLTALNLVVDK
jgi:hypothetical protein